MTETKSSNSNEIVNFPPATQLRNETTKVYEEIAAAKKKQCIESFNKTIIDCLNESKKGKFECLIDLEKFNDCRAHANKNCNELKKQNYNVKIFNTAHDYDDLLSIKW